MSTSRCSTAPRAYRLDAKHASAGSGARFERSVDEYDTLEQSPMDFVTARYGYRDRAPGCRANWGACRISIGARGLPGAGDEGARQREPRFGCGVWSCKGLSDASSARGCHGVILRGGWNFRILAGSARRGLKLGDLLAAAFSGLMLFGLYCRSFFSSLRVSWFTLADLRRTRCPDALRAGLTWGSGIVDRASAVSAKASAATPASAVSPHVAPCQVGSGIVGLSTAEARAQKS